MRPPAAAGDGEESGGARDARLRYGVDRQPEEGRRDGEPRGTRGGGPLRDPLRRGGPEKAGRVPEKRPRQQGDGALSPALLRVHLLDQVGYEKFGGSVRESNPPETFPPPDRI